MKAKLALTGSIGMGKSTTAQMFADAGCVVWDADAAVHRLYAKGGAAVAPLGARFPDVIEQGAVSRPRLRRLLAERSEALAEIESIVHPLVARDREAFIAAHPEAIGVFDIPLVFETGAEDAFDATICVYVDAETQRNRVLSRGTMTEEDLDRILARQIPSAEKCRRADYVIETDTLDHARRQVVGILDEITGRMQDA
jgi:dephospho-CoA kinase